MYPAILNPSIANDLINVCPWLGPPWLELEELTGTVDASTLGILGIQHQEMA